MPYRSQWLNCRIPAHHPSTESRTLNKLITLLVAVSLLGIANSFSSTDKSSLFAGLLGLALVAYSLRKKSEPQRQWRRMTTR